MQFVAFEGEKEWDGLTRKPAPPRRGFRILKENN
jgi:hypothetical protein